MWIKVADCEPKPSQLPCLAWDAIGESIGVWNGTTFSSLPEEYSFDDEDSDGWVFYSEGHQEVIAEITHWRLLPSPPTPDSKDSRDE